MSGWVGGARTGILNSRPSADTIPAYENAEVIMPPTTANGKICYMEIPTTDVRRSADFYSKVFGWKVRTRGDGHLAFDDTVGEVSGSWRVGLPPAKNPGLLIYVMVDSVAITCDSITANGGKIVQPIGGDAPEITARFADLDGNVLGLYQEPSQS